MKPFVLKPRHYIGLTVLTLLLFYNNFTFAQTVNMSLQGDNYIHIHDSSFPQAITWNRLADQNNVAGSYPVVTYWFVKPADAHIIVHLASGDDDLYIELSRKKASYIFPADYTMTDYRYNDFMINAADNSGTMHQITFGKGSALTIQVAQLDPQHLRLNISGTVSVSGVNKAVPVDGKISIAKDNAGLAHLQDSYAGCDNTVYDTESPHADLGQWRSSTECEESLYHKLFADIKDIFAPACASLAAKGWIVNSPKYALLKRINRVNDVNNNYFTMPLPNYTITANADPMKGEYHEYIQKMLEMSKSASLTDASQMEKIQAMSNNAAGRYELVIHMQVNKKVESSTTMDFSKAAVQKLNDSVYLITGIIGDYKNGAGAYIFVGNWGDEPKWDNGHFTSEPMMSDAGKKLSVGAFYVYLGCNSQLADLLLKQIDLAKLSHLLQ
ncbi:MAG: hypothetical protein ACTHJ8_11665 [Mucilaginibacter sp.]